jgi:hypothetical protein
LDFSNIPLSLNKHILEGTVDLEILEFYETLDSKHSVHFVGMDCSPKDWVSNIQMDWNADMDTFLYFTGHGSSHQEPYEGVCLLTKERSYFTFPNQEPLFWQDFLYNVSQMLRNYGMVIDCCHPPWTLSERWFVQPPRFLVCPKTNLNPKVFMSDRGSQCTTSFLKTLESSTESDSNVEWHFFQDHSVSTLKMWMTREKKS